MKQRRNEEDLIAVREILAEMEEDPAFVTESTYFANADIWPDHSIPFVEIHLAYLRSHPQISPEHYISNLRLKLRKTSSVRH